MTKLKIDGALSGAAEISLEDLRGEIYRRPGMRLMAIVELMHTERTEPAPGEDKAPSVKLGIKFIEVARGQQDERLRKAMAFLKLQRTATGTIDEELGSLNLSKSTVDQCAEDLAWEETARLRAALALVADQAGRLATGQFTDRGRVAQLKKLTKVANDLLHGFTDPGGDPS